MKITAEILEIHKQTLEQQWEQGQSPIGVVTAERLDSGSYLVLSFAEDPVWILPRTCFPDNVWDNKRKLNFMRIDNPQLRKSVKQVVGRLLLERKQKGNTLCHCFDNITMFTHFLSRIGIDRFARITPFVTQQYLEQLRSHRHTSGKFKGKGYSQSTQEKLLRAVEVCYQQLRDSPEAFPHPWPEASAWSLIKSGTNVRKAKTLVIPDTVMASVFQFAEQKLGAADELLRYHEADLTFKQSLSLRSSQFEHRIQNISSLGYSGTLADLKNSVTQLETACWFILLSTTGMRIHELCGMQVGECYTRDEDDLTLHFLVSASTKTDAGKTSWLCPRIAIRALCVLERLTVNKRDLLQSQLTQARADGDQLEVNRLVKIARHVMLGVNKGQGNRIAVLSASSINDRLNEFSTTSGMGWHFTTHQFRRTFAQYVVHHKQGDLRYLRDHFKHWSLDMTALYAMDEQQDAELYDEIHLEYKKKVFSLVGHWLEPDTPLAGGLKDKLISLRSIKAGHPTVPRDRELPMRTYGSHKEMIEGISELIFVRSTGIAWCTNSTFNCGGSRCEDCEHSVIDDRMQLQWEAIYAQQLELLNITDIGQSGQSTVERTIKRCEQVLSELGANVHLVNQRFF